jgi:hypothetical protein
MTPPPAAAAWRPTTSDLLVTRKDDQAVITVGAGEGEVDPRAGRTLRPWCDPTMLYPQPANYTKAAWDGARHRRVTGATAITGARPDVGRSKKSAGMPLAESSRGAVGHPGAAIKRPPPVPGRFVIATAATMATAQRAVGLRVTGLPS